MVANLPRPFARGEGSLSVEFIKPLIKLAGGGAGRPISSGVGRVVGTGAGSGAVVTEVGCGGVGLIGGFAAGAEGPSTGAADSL